MISNTKLQDLAQKTIIYPKPYIHQFVFQVRFGNTYALVSSIMDSSNGTIYAYYLYDVFYYTGWRQSPVTTWGYPSRRNISCEMEKENTIIFHKNPIEHIQALQIKGNDEDIEFSEILKKYFEIKKAKLQNLIMQDERKKILW